MRHAEKVIDTGGDMREGQPMNTTKREMLERIYAAETGHTLPDAVDAMRDAECTWRDVADKIHSTVGVTVSRPSLVDWYGNTAQDGAA